MKKALIGAHFSYKHSSQLLGTVTDAISIGATSGAMYISNSRGYNKFPLDMKMVKEAHKIAEENNFNIENLIVHAPLVGNLANTTKGSNIHQRTYESYLKDLKDMHKSGLKYFNFHPGSNEDQENGIKTTAKGINKLINNTKGHKTVILIETMLSKGNYIGRNFEQIGQIIDLVKNKERVGVCLDTCHVFDGGYDIKNELESVLKDFDRNIGLKYLKALHINDSMFGFNSQKDRHQCVGKGEIGTKALHDIVCHKKLKGLPKALETPYGADDFRKWKTEMNLLTN